MGQKKEEFSGVTLWVKLSEEEYSRLKGFFKERPEIKKSYFYGEAILDKLDKEEGE